MAKVMNIIKKLHQKTVIDRIKETNWHKGSNAPLVVEFDTTEVCNLACPGCISEDLVSHQTSFTKERLLEIAKEMYEVGVKAVILIGGGEPLAHPAVGDFIEYLGSHDIHIGITTNGCFIDKYMDVIAKYASWTRVSMDAGTADGFFRVRPAKSGKNEFNHIVSNMRRLGKLKTGKLGYSYLIRTEKDGFGLKSNIDELYVAAQLARDIGCDYFEVKPSYSYVGGQDHALVIHNKEDMNYAKEEIKRLDDLETDTFKVIKAINLSDSLNCVEHAQDKDYHKCLVAELRTLITPSGAYICPYWRGKEKFKIGNLNTSSFSDVWHSERRREVVSYCDPSKRCTFHCLRHISNLEVLQLIGTPIDDIETVEEYDRFI